MNGTFVRTASALAILVALSAGVRAKVAHAQSAEPQSIPTSEASNFLGNWNLAFEGPQGPFNMSLSITDANGRLAAQLSSDMADAGMSLAVRQIRKVENDLVLQYEADFQGQMFPVAISLKPAGDKVNASVDFADGQFLIDGTATKQQ